ncbi:TPA: hypothetical protein HA251_07985 [Candidatus Woesearchaeota archaeon]|nr:hypothetical protein [Candidatus Woesearchaeota archaeon]
MNITQYLKKIWNGKLALSSTISLLGIIVVIFLGSSTYFSNESNNCNYEINKLLLNKTQQFIEKQALLIERTWSIGRRDIFEAIGNKEEAAAAQSSIPGPYVTYREFLDASTKQDVIISQKMEDCATKEHWATICLAIAFATATIQLLISIKHLRTYRP